MTTMTAGLWAEAEVTGPDLDVLVVPAVSVDEAAYGTIAIGAAVDRRRRDRCGRAGVPGQRAPQGDQGSHGIRPAPGQVDRMETAEAPTDDADRTRLAVRGQQLVEAVGDACPNPRFCPSPQPRLR